MSKAEDAVSKHISKNLDYAMQIASRGLSWWMKFLPWQLLFKRGFYAGMAYAAVLQQKGIQGKTIVKHLGAKFKTKIDVES